MRYMGDVSLATMDQATKSQLLALAPMMTDGQAQDIAEIVEATNYGKNQRWLRLGIGAAFGLVLGVVGSRVLGKKRK
jgi:ElaB/YqjD/DUF883 family membrane-anchored ribosome-binding protein